jgi:alpha-ribazole phosphatase CobZ
MCAKPRENYSQKIAELLARYNVSFEDLADAGLALYVGVGHEPPPEVMREKLLVLLERECADVNVYLLFCAAAALETRWREVGGSRDDAEIVSDELLGMCIAEYIAGKRGLFNFMRYDREKPGVLAELPVFIDDAAGALVAACMTKLFSRCARS